MKYPLWFDTAGGKASLARAADFRDALEDKGIDMVGLLCGKGPAAGQSADARRKTDGGDDWGLPQASAGQTGPVPFGAIFDKVALEMDSGSQASPRLAADETAPAETPSTPAAELFAPPVKVWYPSLEPTMLRLATQVRWWQLGTDEDTSFVGSTDLPAKIADVKGALDRLGQDVCVGIGWDWRAALPAAAKPPWQFLTLSAQPPLEAAELARQLDAPRAAGTVRWVVLRAFPAEGHTPQARVEDLVRRMLAAKMRGADGIFCPDPFDAQCGLMEPDGSPGELLLPWRTTALMLGGAKYLGAAELPGGSASAVFTRRGEAVLVLWNPRPQDETLYLGPNLRQVDLWGRVTQPAERDGGLVVRAEQLPTFVLGASEPLVRWQLAFALAHGQIEAIPMQPQDDSFSLKNTFAEAVNVKVKLTAPAGWTVEPKEFSLHLSAGAESQQAFRITLPTDALSGRQALEAGIDIRAGRSYRLRLQRPIAVGLGDVDLAASGRLNDRGELEVQQTMANHGKQPVNFRCGLYAPDRCRQPTLVLGLAGGPDVQVYRLPKGAELLGKTLWVRAEEVDGPRVLNCRLTVSGPPIASSAGESRPLTALPRRGPRL